MVAVREQACAMPGTSRSGLAAELQRCARFCEETAERYVDRRADPEAVSSLLLAAAALDTAAGAVETSDAATALLIAATLVRDAGEASGLGALLDVAELCERELGDG